MSAICPMDMIQRRLTTKLRELDERPSSGRFVLTGSQHFGLSEAISQTLAGRCGMLTLLPPSLEELRHFPDIPDQLYPLLWQGACPRIYDQQIPARQWLEDYLATYIQRDVRQVLNVVYGGETRQQRSAGSLVPWRDVGRIVAK